MTDRVHQISLGKIDYNNSGRHNCLVTIEWSLEGGRFSASGSIWNPRKTDIYSGGQNLEEIAKLFPSHKLAQRIIDVWRAWHLNDMKAGSPAQEAWLKTNPVKAVYPESHYEKAGAALAAAGLNPDPSCIHNGAPYRYGSAWLKVELPTDVIAEIESWDA
jgi:hypothetical protein